MLEILTISKKFPKFELKNINLNIDKNDYYIILGPSGAGKTLLLEIIAGLAKADSGKINNTNNSKIGFIYQDYMLFPHLSVFDNIAYGLKIQKTDKKIIKEKVLKIASEFSVDHLLSRDTKNLSGGEKQRVAVARTMILDPDIVLLDEPTSALDHKTKRDIQKIFKKIHNEKQKTFIHVTHDFEEALNLATSIAVINNGTIIQQGDPEKVFNHPKSKFTADFLGYENVFKGIIENHRFIVENCDFSIYIEKDNCDFVYAAIRSDEIILSPEKLKSSAQNSFLGKIIGITKKLSSIEITLDIGIVISCFITYDSFHKMDLKANRNIWATFKTSSVKIFNP